MKMSRRNLARQRERLERVAKGKPPPSKYERKHRGLAEPTPRTALTEADIAEWEDQ